MNFRVPLHAFGWAAFSLMVTTFSLGSTQVPELLLINPARLQLLATSEESSMASQRANLLREADAVLEKGKTYSVTFNEKIPPSGDKRDYYSTGPYWWPNPDTVDGLPYIRRDGVFNPERDRVSDHGPLRELMSDLRALSLAYVLSGDGRYAAWGTKLIRIWFLDESTQMRPNLNHAQAIPGVTDGRGTGIIDTHPFAELIDYILILKSSPEMGAEEFDELLEWFSSFTDWLLQSENGKAEQASINNHGTAFDLQVSALLWFCGREKELGPYLRAFTLSRIDKQITDKGTQPHELSRTRTWSYCTENLEHFFKIGLIARKVDVDIFNYTGASGGSLRKALDYLLPYVCHPDEWPHEQKTEWQERFIRNVLSIATGVYHDGKLAEAEACLADTPEAIHSWLLKL